MGSFSRFYIRIKLGILLEIQIPRLHPSLGNQNIWEWNQDSVFKKRDSLSDSHLASLTLIFRNKYFPYGVARVGHD